MARYLDELQRNFAPWFGGLVGYKL
jgi:hypothetical protein